MVYSAVLAVCGMDGRGLKPRPELPPVLVDMSLQSAGVAPEVNLRIIQAKKHTSDPPWL